MESQAERDALHLAQTENRHLRDTICALRDELERMRIDKDDSVHQAVLSASDEIVQLRTTVTILRDELERTTNSYEKKLQELEWQGRDEIHQLQQTIRILREQLGEYNARLELEKGGGH